MPIVSEPLGRVLGNRYRLVSALGTGASAHVFLAEDTVLQRRVAVKVLQPALVKDEGFLRRFRAEARSVAAMNHPYVLRVFDWGEDDDGPYLVLEYLEGGSLFDMLSRAVRLTPAQAARVGSQAAAGLAYAHARGIIHRDVKPANILFDEEGRVRVADFGVARALAGSALTEPTGTMIGTARYASPEQAQGLPLDGRSDVYSLALVLYEAITGESAFAGDTPIAILQARIGEPLPHHPALGLLDDPLSLAAASDHEIRPDAAELSQRLESLADRAGPAFPLPLARRPQVGAGGEHDQRRGGTATGIGASGAAGVASQADDLTLGVLPMEALAGGAGGAGAGVRGRGGSGVLGAEAFDPTRFGGGPIADGTLAMGGVGGVVGTMAGAPTMLGNDPTASVALQGGPPGRRRASRLRRRWPWVAGVLVVVALLVAAGAVYAVREKLFTPSHPVPSLVDKPVATARKAVLADHFALVVDPAVHSLTVQAGDVVRQTPAQGVSVKEGSVVHVVPSAGLPTVRVPSLSGGLNCTAAARVLAEVHLKDQCPAAQAYTKTTPAGDIMSWSYDGKTDPTTAPYGATILIAVSQGKPPVAVPPVSGTFTDADNTLRALGFQVKEVQSYSTTVPSGQVIGTTPAVGTTIPYGSTVTVQVSQGVHYVTVPNVSGKNVAQATAILQKTGLGVAQVYGPPGGKVFTSVPLAGQQVKYGSAVTLYTQ